MSGDLHNEEGRPATEVIGTPLHLRQGASPASDAELNDTTSDAVQATANSARHSDRVHVAGGPFGVMITSRTELRITPLADAFRERPIISTSHRLISRSDLPANRLVREPVPDLPGAFIYRERARQGERITLVYIADGIAAAWCMGERTVRIAYEAQESDEGAEPHFIFRYHQPASKTSLVSEMTGGTSLNNRWGKTGLSGVFDELARIAWVAARARAAALAS